MIFENFELGMIEYDKNQNFGRIRKLGFLQRARTQGSSYINLF